MPSPGGGTTVVELNSGNCPTGWTTETLLYDDNDPGCTTCTCGPSVGTCTGVHIQRFSDGSCANFKDEADVDEGDCWDVGESSSTQARGYDVEYSLATIQGCPASSSSPVALDPDSVCQLAVVTGQTCDGGSGVCVPPPGGDVGRICTLLTGHVSCPTGYPNAQQLYRTPNDTRSCSCTCSNQIPDDYCSGISFSIHENTDCTGGAASSGGYGCVSATNFTSHDGFRLDSAGTYVPGNCPPVDGHTGNVTFSDPVTLCCTS
ncbi:MAG: hypothetical protein JRI55_31910 [Deltaproteobacteria bacterium]|nr:hypothetical protein [Deltaproteobacteria bacterium]